MNDEALLRYSRHILLPELDIEGQEKLLASRVLLVGLGGLGCPVAMYLAASGVGTLVLADFDEVELSNLQRQIAHSNDRLGVSKVTSAAQTVRALNPDCNTLCINEKLTGESLREQVALADLVLDCTDRFSARFEINKTCIDAATPLVSGAAIGMEGQLAVFNTSDSCSPCYRCLYHSGDDSTQGCAESGVLAPLVGVIGSLQALEALKLLAGVGESSVGKFLVYDARSLSWQVLKLPRRTDCPDCGGRPTNG